MKMKSKALLAVLCAVLLVGASMFGTLAWLTDKTTEVKNTFTVGDINITLTESEDLDLKIIPDKEIFKDPVVTVEEGSEACWLFVEVIEKNWPDFKEADGKTRKVNYSIDSDWTPVPDNPGVYYREVSAIEKAEDGDEPNDAAFPVLADDKVTVSENLTKEEMEKITTPTLTFYAYAVQSDGVETAAGAWAIAKPASADA